MIMLVGNVTVTFKMQNFSRKRYYYHKVDLIYSKIEKIQKKTVINSIKGVY